jgi:hypothetical protein
VATPVLPDDSTLVFDDVFDFSSGYLQRGKHLQPKSATDMRWRLSQDYVRDRKFMKSDPIEDGVLQLARAGAGVIAEPLREAAE